VNGSPIALLYDIHGNLAALEAVLADAETGGATSYLLGGDYAAFGPCQAELDGILVCHGSPRSDIESFAPEAQPGEERMLDGEAQRTILFGHSHQQFRRSGPNGTLLVNPGSVGAPLDGDPPRGLGAARRRRDPLPQNRLRRRASGRADALLRRLGRANRASNRARIRLRRCERWTLS